MPQQLAKTGVYQLPLQGVQENYGDKCGMYYAITIATKIHPTGR